MKKCFAIRKLFNAIYHINIKEVTACEILSGHKNTHLILSHKLTIKNKLSTV